MTCVILSFMKYAYKCKNYYRTKIENVSKFQYFVQMKLVRKI